MRQVLAAIFGLVLAAAGATAQDAAPVRHGITAEELQAIVQEMGHRALIDEDEIGPYIVSPLEGDLNFYIGLESCDEATMTNCTVLSFITDSLPGADADKARRAALAWNNSVDWASWSRASLDSEGRPALVYNVSINGGVTDGHIRIVLQDFLADIEAFREMLAE